MQTVDDLKVTGVARCYVANRPHCRTHGELESHVMRLASDACDSEQIERGLALGREMCDDIDFPTLGLPDARLAGDRD
jgi:hypothetical protein